MKPSKIIGYAILASFAALLIWGMTRPGKIPATPRIEKSRDDIARIEQKYEDRQDAELVRQLIGENLGERRFRFGTVMEAASGKKVLTLRLTDPAHARVHAAITTALGEACTILSQPDSPVRGLRRINEASRYFEDILLEKLDAQPDLAATIPTTQDGRHQRSGYPDIRIEHEESGTIFYLDPKLVEQSAWASTLRTFYFEPKCGSLKITDDAIHLLAGIPHDGKDGAWTFGEAKLIDLSLIHLRLKPEFQASNADLYPEP